MGYLDKKTPFWKPFLFMLPALAVLGFFTIYPFIITADLSLHPMGNENDAAATSFGFDAYKQVFTDYYFKQALSNSLIYAFISIPASIVLSLIISATIANVIRKKIRGAWQTIFFLPYVTSGVAISLAFAYLFDNDTGLINKMLGAQTNWLENAKTGDHHALVVMIVHGVWAALAFQILIFTTAMLGVDKDRYKAASIDGAGHFKQFFTITLPSISKTLNFVITVGLIGAIKVFPLALFQMDPAKAELYGGSTLMLFVYKNVAVGNYQVAGAAAIILVVIAIAFNVVVKNAFNLTGKLIVKGGEWRVEKKITNTIRSRK